MLRPSPNYGTQRLPNDDDDDDDSSLLDRLLQTQFIGKLKPWHRCLAFDAQTAKIRRSTSNPGSFLEAEVLRYVFT